MLKLFHPEGEANERLNPSPPEGEANERLNPSPPEGEG
jgi:hypothetical protein